MDAIKIPWGGGGTQDKAHQFLLDSPSDKPSPSMMAQESPSTATGQELLIVKARQAIKLNGSLTRRTEFRDITIFSRKGYSNSNDNKWAEF